MDHFERAYHAILFGGVGEKALRRYQRLQYPDRGTRPFEGAAAEAFAREFAQQYAARIGAYARSGKVEDLKDGDWMGHIMRTAPHPTLGYPYGIADQVDQLLASDEPGVVVDLLNMCIDLTVADGHNEGLEPLII